MPARGLCPVPDLGDRAVNPVGSRPRRAVGRRRRGVDALPGHRTRGGQRWRRRGVGRRGRRRRLRRADRRGARRRRRRHRRRRRAAGATDAVRRGADAELGAGWTPKTLRKKVREFADARGVPVVAHQDLRGLRTSGGPGAGLWPARATAACCRSSAIHAKTVELRLSNLMAFDAMAQGNWGCLPEHYPAVVDLVLSGRIALDAVRRPPARSPPSTTSSPSCITARRAAGIVLIPEA